MTLTPRSEHFLVDLTVSGYPRMKQTSAKRGEQKLVLNSVVLTSSVSKL